MGRGVNFATEAVRGWADARACSSESWAAWAAAAAAASHTGPLPSPLRPEPNPVPVAQALRCRPVAPSAAAPPLAYIYISATRSICQRHGPRWPREQVGSDDDHSAHFVHEVPAPAKTW